MKFLVLWCWYETCQSRVESMQFWVALSKISAHCRASGEIVAQYHHRLPCSICLRSTCRLSYRGTTMATAGASPSLAAKMSASRSPFNMWAQRTRGHLKRTCTKTGLMATWVAGRKKVSTLLNRDWMNGPLGRSLSPCLLPVQSDSGA